MKILLTVPLSRVRFNVTPDIGLGYLAAHARKSGHDVMILDCVVERLSYRDFLRTCEKFQFDLIGFKTYSCDIEPVRKMVAIVREALPNAITAIGGPHPSCENPEQLFHSFPGLHVAFSGEAEISFCTYLDQLKNQKPDFSSVAGLIWRDSEGNIRGNPKLYFEELDMLEFPAWDLINPRHYNNGYTFMSTRLPAAPLQITRGCPYSCTFCGSHQITGKKVRRRSVDNVIREITMLKEEYGVRTIDVIDENFAFHKEYIIEFCKRLIEEKIEIAWNCPYGMRLDHLDEEIVRYMEQSGCFGMSVGVESGSQRVLDRIKKNLTVDEVREKVMMIKRVSRLYVFGFFIIGFPGERKEEIEQTIRLACELPFDLATFCPLRITPDSAIFRDLLAEGKVDVNLDYQGLGHPYFVRSYNELSDREMLGLYRRAYLKFYLRPRIIFNLIRRVRILPQVKNILLAFLRIFHKPPASEPAG